MPGRNLREETQILERRKRVADMYLARQPNYRIAAAVGVDVRTLQRDLKFLREQWRESAKEAIDTRQWEELARIDHLEAVAWTAWERSCEDAETRTASLVQGRTDAEGEPLPDLKKSSQMSKGQSGNPAFLERIAWCIDERCKILGILNASTNVNVYVRPVSDSERSAILSAAFTRLGVSVTPSSN